MVGGGNFSRWIIAQSSQYWLEIFAHNERSKWENHFSRYTFVHTEDLGHILFLPFTFSKCDG